VIYPINPDGLECQFIQLLIENIDEFQKDYEYDSSKNEYFHNLILGDENEKMREWFNLSSNRPVEIG
jgi:hypothetical protein